MDICIDFDGTLCEHEFPAIGNEVPGAFAVLKELQAAGHRLILWTMRSDDRVNYGDLLRFAVEWCRERGIEFYGANRNPDQNWTKSPKAYANLYIDDAALGCPLFLAAGDSKRPMVDWAKVREILVQREIIPA